MGLSTIRPMGVAPGDCQFSQGERQSLLHLVLKGRGSHMYYEFLSHCNGVHLNEVIYTVLPRDICKKAY